MAGVPYGPAGGGSQGSSQSTVTEREHDMYLPAPSVVRIMKKVLPPNAKIPNDTKLLVQECATEFVGLVTSEAGHKCQQEKRKVLDGDDLLWSLKTLGFDDYIDPLRAYLMKYRAEESKANKGV